MSKMEKDLSKKSLAKLIWGIIYPMLIYVAVQLMVVNMFQLGYMAYFYIKGITSREIIWQMMADALQGKTLLLTMVSALVTIPILAIFMKRDINRQKKQNTYKQYKLDNKLLYLLIIPFGVFNMIWANMFVSILQMFMPQFMIDSYSDTATAIYGSSTLLQFVAAGIFGPIVEELIFRGLIYKRTRDFSNIKVAAILSAVLFGIFHQNWVQAPYAIIIGLVAVFVYEKYKSIIAPILFHMSANIASVLIAYIASKLQTGQVANTEQLSVGYAVKALTSSMMTFLFIAFVIGFIINNIVNAKEVNNEVIDSSDSML